MFVILAFVRIHQERPDFSMAIYEMSYMARLIPSMPDHSISLR